MPTWAIHLSIAKKLNTKLNLSKDEFLFGNILPDIPNGYYIKDISSIISYNETHFIPVDEDKYINCPKIPKYNEKIYFDSIKLLKLTKDDIKKTINYLNNKYYKDNIKSNDEYKLIPFNELLKIYEGCIEFINSEIEKSKK